MSNRDDIGEISKGTEQEWMRNTGKELKKEAENLKGEIQTLRNTFIKEIKQIHSEITEIKRARIIQEQKRSVPPVEKKQPEKPEKKLSLEDMRGEWAVLVAKIDKMSRSELISARDRIQTLGEKLDTLLGENYLSITQDAIKKIDHKLR